MGDDWVREPWLGGMSGTQTHQPTQCELCILHFTASQSPRLNQQQLMSSRLFVCFSSRICDHGQGVTRRQPHHRSGPATLPSVGAVP